MVCMAVCQRVNRNAVRIKAWVDSNATSSVAIVRIFKMKFEIQKVIRAIPTGDERSLNSGSTPAAIIARIGKSSNTKRKLKTE